MMKWLLPVVIVVGVAGWLAPAVLAEDKDDGSEVKVKLEDCPKAVQATIKREVGSGELLGVCKETERGKTVYEAEARIDGKLYDIEVAEDGTLICKELDDDEDD